MKKYFIIIFLMLLESVVIWNLHFVSLADTPLAKELTITQIKITGDEFIVLRNNSTSNLRLNNYWLQYFNDYDLTRTSSVSSSQLPDVWLQPQQEILLTSGTTASCGPVWVSKLPFTLKDSSGMLQILGISQTGGIVGYKPQDQISWSSSSNPQSAFSVDIKGVSSSKPIYYKTDSAWEPTSTPPGCLAASSSLSSSTNTPDTLTKSSTSPPAVLLTANSQDNTWSNSANAGLIAPQLSEILPNPASPKTDANDEFIELYNPNDQPFDISGFKLQVGTSTTYNYIFPEGTKLSAYEFKAFYSSQTNLPLSNTTSKVKFLDPNDSVLAISDTYSNAQDDISWIFAEGLWQWTKIPTPNSRNVITSIDTAVLSNSSSVRPPATISNQKYLPLVITELLPNPKSPQTDANDEFIEIYNPNDKAVNLAGYTLVSGIKDSYKYTIKEGIIETNSYLVFYRPSTKLTLSNTSGRVKLLAPDGSQVDISGDYATAPDGQSWIYANDKWQWTTIPTPGKANIFSAPVTKETGKAGNRTNARTNSLGSSANNPKASSLHPMILAAVGSAVILYAIYEYRHDLANLIYRFRRNRAARRAVGPTTQTPGSFGAAV